MFISELCYFNLFCVTLTLTYFNGIGGSHGNGYNYENQKDVFKNIHSENF